MTYMLTEDCDWILSALEDYILPSRNVSYYSEILLFKSQNAVFLVRFVGLRSFIGSFLQILFWGHYQRLAQIFSRTS
jgi:hypothetical protein